MPIPIAFDKPRHLHFDLLSLKDLEEKMGGQPIGAIVQQLQQAGVTAIIYALWAGLKHEDAALTPNLVTKMLTRYIEQGQSLVPIAHALNDALEESRVFQGVSAVASAPNGHVPRRKKSR